MVACLYDQKSLDRVGHASTSLLLFPHNYAASATCIYKAYDMALKARAQSESLGEVHSNLHLTLIVKLAVAHVPWHTG